MQITLTALMIAIIMRLLYGCRICTFAIWTNAAMISHSHAVITVAAIELIVLVIVALGTWLLVGFILYKLAD